MLTVADIYRKLQTASENKEESTLPPAPLTLAPPLQKILKVLVVEDIVSNQKFFLKLLKGLLPHCTFIVASNGEEAVTKFKKEAESDQPIDVVLMDLEMPIMDGQTATFHIRNLPYGNITPIICVSTLINSDEQLTNLTSQMDGFLVKPINKVKLDKLMNALPTPVPTSPQGSNVTDTAPPPSPFSLSGSRNAFFTTVSERVVMEQTPTETSTQTAILTC